MLDDWDITWSEDRKSIRGGNLYRNGSRNNHLATVVPKDESWVWLTTGAGHSKGSSGSFASATARAERALRTQGVLPYLETRKTRVPACGHVECIDLMGCAAVADAMAGRPPLETSEFPPGVSILLHKVSNTGLRLADDWIWEMAL